MTTKEQELKNALICSLSALSWSRGFIEYVSKDEVKHLRDTERTIRKALGIKDAN